MCRAVAVVVVVALAGVPRFRVRFLAVRGVRLVVVVALAGRRLRSIVLRLPFLAQVRTVESSSSTHREPQYDRNSHQSGNGELE